jgi:hypothetical protein
MGSLFCREFAGVTGLAFNTIRGRDGCTRNFGRDGYENLSGVISWLTFSPAEQLTSGEAKVIGGGNSQRRHRPSRAGSRTGPTGPYLGTVTVTLSSPWKSTPFCDEN